MLYKPLNREDRLEKKKVLESKHLLQLKNQDHMKEDKKTNKLIKRIVIIRMVEGKAKTFHKISIYLALIIKKQTTMRITVVIGPELSVRPANNLVTLRRYAQQIKTCIHKLNLNKPLKTQKVMKSYLLLQKLKNVIFQLKLKMHG